MAKERIVNVRFWRDHFIMGLRPDARLLFLWAITNPATELCGAYETPLATIEAETGLRGKRIREIFDQFEAAGKMIYKDGWVIIANFAKHQHGTSTSIKAGIERTLSYCPDWVKDTVGGRSRQSDIYLDSVRQPKPIPKPEGKPPLKEIFIGTVTAGLCQRLGTQTLPAEREWQGEMIWAFTNGFTSDQFLACYDSLKAEDFWKRKALPPKQISKHLPQLRSTTDAKPKRPTGRELAAEVAQQEAAS